MVFVLLCRAVLCCFVLLLFFFVLFADLSGLGRVAVYSAVMCWVRPRCSKVFCVDSVVQCMYG